MNINKVLSLFNKSWFAWPLYTAVGSGLGFLIDFILSLDPDQYYYQFLIELTILGFFTSLGQYILLRNKLRQAWLWIPATTIGFIVGYDAYGFVVPFEVYALLSPIAIGLFVGVFQSLVLRSKIKTSLIWIVISIASWNIAYGLILPSLYMKFDGFLLGAITGLVIGGVSGLFIDFVLIKHQSIDLLIPQNEAS